MVRTGNSKMYQLVHHELSQDWKVRFGVLDTNLQCETRGIVGRLFRVV